MPAGSPENGDKSAWQPLGVPVNIGNASQKHIVLRPGHVFEAITGSLNPVIRPAGFGGIFRKGGPVGPCPGSISETGRQPRGLQRCMEV